MSEADDVWSRNLIGDAKASKSGATRIRAALQGGLAFRVRGLGSAIRCQGAESDWGRLFCVWIGWVTLVGS